MEKVEQSGKWPQQACTTMFFLIPKNVTSERPIAHMPTLIRWWEALRAPEVAKWQQKYCADWDATDGRNGEAQRTVWEVLMEMERFNGRAKAEDQGTVALVLDLAKAFERVSLFVVWAWATHFSFPRKLLRVLVRILRAPKASAVRRDVWRSRSGPSRPFSLGLSGVACFCALCCRMRQVRLRRFTLR